GIGHVQAAGEMPHQKSIYRAAENLSRLRLLPDAATMVRQPADLEPAEISGQRKARLRPEPVSSAAARELGDRIAYPCVLPDERVVHRASRLAAPKDCGFPLVGDANRRQIARPQPEILHRLRHNS